MAPATVNNHLAHLSALFSWIAVHAPAGLLRHGDPTKKVDQLRLPAPQVRALAEAQVARNSTAAWATPTTATCACTPTRPTTSPPATSKTSELQDPPVAIQTT